MSKTELLVGNVTILDRGDGPAQEVLDRNARAIAQRVADETRDELNKVMGRVKTSLEQFETSSKLDFGDSSHGGVEYVNDLAELEELLGDQMKRKKYQQHLTVFVVGYQNKSGQRLRLLQQIGEFFTDTINRWDADEATPKSPDIDLEETDKNIHESLQTANELAGRLGELNREMMDYMYTYATSKAGNNGIPLFQNRKKLEKSLIQAKEEMALLTEKLSTMQKELEEKEEKIQQLFKQVEMKTMETQRLKAAAEVTKRNIQDTSAITNTLDSKDQAIKELQKKIEALELDLKQKEASREQTQKELLMTGRESIIKVKELEDKLQTAQLERMQEKREETTQGSHPLQEFGEKQLTTLANVHRQEMTEMKAKYESEIGRLKLIEKQDTDVKALQYQIGEHKRQVEVLKQQLEQAEASKQRALEDALKAAKEQSDAALAAAMAAAAAAVATPSASDDRAASSNKDEAEEGQGSKSKQVQGTQVKNGTSRKADTKGTKPQRSKDGIDGSEEGDKVSDELADGERKVVKPQQSAQSEPPAIDYESSFFDEGVWGSLQSEHVPEIFLKYRNKAVEKVKRLEIEVEEATSKAAKKVETLKAQFHEHKERWQQERDSFVEQIELAQKMRREAELEADAALNKLEDFISEQESLEKDEEKNAVARQQALAQREATVAAEVASAAAVPSSSAPADVASHAKATGSEARSSQTASAQQDVFLMADATKDAVADEKPASSMLQLPPAGAASKSISPLTVDAATSPAPSMVSAAKVTEQVLDGLRQLMLEERLDVVQQNALSEFRSAIEFSKQQQQQLGLGSSPVLSQRATAAAVATGEDDKRLRTLAVFGLASKLSSESYHLGYEPESLLQALISLYANGGRLFYSWKPGMSAIVINSNGGGDAPVVLPAMKSSRDVSARNGSMARDEIVADESALHLDLESITADNGEADSVQAEPNSTEDGSDHSRSPLDMAESLKSESLVASHTVSGRSSPDSQMSVHNKYRSVLEEARASLEERRRSRSSAASRVSVPSKASFHDAELDEDGDMPFPEDANGDGPDTMRTRSPAGRVSLHNKSTEVSRRSYYDRTTSFSLKATSVTSYSPSPSIVSKEDAATSPHFIIIDHDNTEELDIDSWKSPPLSSHPVVFEYLKVYSMVHNFKEAIAKALQDKDMMSASQILNEIEPLVLDEANPVTPQIEDMTKSISKVLDDTSAAVDSALTALAGKEYRVSSLLSIDRRSGTAGSFYSTRQNSADFLPSSARMQRHIKTPAPIMLTNTPIEATALKDLQQRFDILQKEYVDHKQKHEIEVQHNAVMLMEMQDHVAELQRRLSESGRNETAVPVKHRPESGHKSPVMFTRLDAERNTKNLKRAALNNRVDPTRLSDALAKMEAYISIPEQRFSEIVKKYVHLMNMRKIAKTIRDSQNLTRTELSLLTRIDAMQSNKHKHWLRRMDELGYERMRLAAELTEFLEALEMESGIFLIKPIFSYQGFQGEDLHDIHEKFTSYAHRGTIAGAPGLSIYKRELQMEPLTTPASQGMLGNRATGWTSDYHHNRHGSWQPAAAWEPPATGSGSGITGMMAPLASMGLPSLGYSWSVSSSVVKDHARKASAPLLDTPRILEMDVNRMMYGQSQVSAKIPIGDSGNSQAGGERGSSYLRSYVTVSRPVKPSAAVKPTERPLSGDSVIKTSPDSKQPPPADAVSASWPGKGRSSPLPPIVKTQGQQYTGSTGNVLMAREYSEDAITPNRLMKLIESARSEVSTPEEADEDTGND